MKTSTTTPATTTAPAKGLLTRVNETIATVLAAVVNFILRLFVRVALVSTTSSFTVGTVLLWAASAAMAAAAAIVFFFGLPYWLCVSAGLGLLAWLGRDAYAFLTGFDEPEAQAEAVARLVAVHLAGVLVFACLATSPVAGAAVTALVVTGMLYRQVCCRAGTFEIHERLAARTV